MKFFLTLLIPIFSFALDPEVVQSNAKFYGFFTLIPPIVAISLAFITKDVILSLFLGAFSGAFMLAYKEHGFFASIAQGFLKFIDKAVGALGDPTNAGIVLQVLCIGGVVALITKMGGTKAIASWLSKKAKSHKSSQISTWLMGIIIFFDDYANSLIVGPIMRPVTDKFKVSREKLAFIMDATAAPITGIAIISTWIGLEISVIKMGYDLIDPKFLTHLNVDVHNLNAFGIFVETIPYRFYNLFMLVFVVLTVMMGREFGPMLKAERNARNGILSKGNATVNNIEDKILEPDEGVSLRVSNALIPISVLIIGSFIGFYFSGLGALEADIAEKVRQSPLSFFAFRETFGAADASVVLFQAALAATIVAIIMGVYRKIFNVKEGIVIWTHGWRTMIMTIIILITAWSLSSVIKDLGTSKYLVEILSDNTPYYILPAIIFIFASVISFATGTSYGTMGILMPLAIPLSVAIGVNTGVENLHHFMIICISGVLTGAIFGDHCSPISDTTILSSMGSGCNHIDHVSTQIPYALLICGISIILGYIPVTFGLNVWITLIIGVIATALILRIIGKKVD